MVNISNPVYFDLIKSKVIKKSNKLDIISNKTRDKKIKVLRDPAQRIIFLEKFITTEKYYSSISRNEKKIIIL